MTKKKLPLSPLCASRCAVFLFIPVVAILTTTTHRSYTLCSPCFASAVGGFSSFKMSSYVASSPPSIADTDLLGESARHPTVGVMFITGSPRFGAQGSCVSGTAPPATAHSAFSSGIPSKGCVHFRNAAGFS
ncbi:hypothetical protein E2C01_072658 [Portunus trituberculatus]|uniref:Uncharacterized protein n=1 Tax=Portunus trituberculatus TaxID=210409 RepID=A0A5B7I8G1_PORTR|nr:hypothetical protein [Portunus trituberculatus]